MKPVYVCQLPEGLQDEIRGILARLLLYQCGSEGDVERSFGMSLADAVQLGMDSKIADIDCAADPLRNGSYEGQKIPENVGKDMERLMEIIAQGQEIKVEDPVPCRTEEKGSAIPDQRIREILDAALRDYADRMQGRELYDFLGGTLWMTDAEIEALGFRFAEEDLCEESEER